MKFLLLVCSEEGKMDALPRREWNALIDAHVAYDEVLRERGHFLVAKPLESVRTATTVRITNGKLMVTDGPFAETKEQVAGFFLIEARDHEEAIAVAAKVPSLRHGCIEVRPVRELAGMKEPE